MPIFLLFGKYTTEALRGISAERTRKVTEIIKRHDGEVKSMYCVLGEHDLVFTLVFPDAEKALAASVDLQKATGIAFNTSPVVDVEAFDRLIGATKDI